MVWLSVLGLFLVLAALPFPFARAGRVMAQPQPPQAPPVFAGDITGQGIIPGALLTPTPGVIVTDPQVTFDWANATTDDSGGIISYTLLITGANTTREITTVTSIHTTTLTANGPYTWTVQAYDANGGGDYAPPATFTPDAVYRVFLPIINKPECPSTSSASFDLISIDGSPAEDHPDYLHGDLNLALRGYNVVDEAKNLVDYSGGTDPNAPRLAGLFEPHDFPGISAVYQVNDWNWNCGEHGCRGPALTNPPVTLAGLLTSKGQALYIPERSPDIYGGGYKAMVLYAEEKRITLNYTREDTVANGYTVHIENVCVDPNLLALYRAQTNNEGYHTGALPALRNNQALGTALGTEIQVAIRDRGRFMDPRSRKDWWPGY